jgi:Metallo-peptidase family M12B Reprolysin-like/Secretion system C-terminal sorting domain
MKTKYLSTILVAMAFAGLQAQETTYWQAAAPNNLASHPSKIDKVQALPDDAKYFKLNLADFKTQLFAVQKNSKQTLASKIISIPNAQGQMEQFEVFEASNFEPELQAKFPDIRAYSGKGITDKGATLKISFAPEGIKTMVLRANERSEYMEPYSESEQIYAVYQSQRKKGDMGLKCSTKDRKMHQTIKAKLPSSQKSTNRNLSTMRLAMSCTGEYANFFNANSSADVARVLAAYNATLTRCNGIFERDLALHLNLIARSTEVIFYNPSTDPYDVAQAYNASTNMGMDRWNGQLMNTLRNTLGDAAYDIGHLLAASGGGGDAGCIGCVCSNDATLYDVKTGYPNAYKGSAYTAAGNGGPQGDVFDVDYVSHEIGHQLGGEHTYTYELDANNVQVEIGTGISIMGYAGVKAKINVSNRSIDAFHGLSIQQIQNNLDSKACIIRSDISANNALPSISASPNISIPINTPFALVAVGTDANTSQVLTYSWEQIDRPSTFSTTFCPASATKLTGPNFISLPPHPSPIRFMPNMAAVMRNETFSGPLIGGDPGMNAEVLSSVSRDSKFMVTVRDNAPYSSVAPVSVGQSNSAQMTISTNDTGGAFAVTSQAADGLTYLGNSRQNITWQAGATGTAPFNASQVDVLITYDNGVTWTILLAQTPNDGQQLVSMPDVEQKNCRIMVRSAVTAPNQLQAYFFNVNTKAFAIKNSNGLNVMPDQGLKIYPNPSSGIFELELLPKSTAIGIKIYDMVGNLVYVSNHVASSFFTQSLDLAHLSKGAYVLTLFEAGNQSYNQRVIIK